MQEKNRVIKLKGGVDVIVNLGNPSKCQACRKKIWWAETLTKKQMPIHMCGLIDFESHFATCPAAKKFRKKN